jgi:hypothetical protein
MRRDADAVILHRDSAVLRRYGYKTARAIFGAIDEQLIQHKLD